MQSISLVMVVSAVTVLVNLGLAFYGIPHRVSCTIALATDRALAWTAEAYSGGIEVAPDYASKL